MEGLVGMTAVNIAISLNQGFPCPNCKARASWHAAGRVAVRTNSTLQRFRCASCGERVVVKLASLRTREASGRRELEKEYQTLRKLQGMFSPDGRYGTLLAMGYMEFDGYAAMITRLFRGEDLIRCARSADSDELDRMFHCAGALLRTLHDACPDGYQTRTLDVESKLAYLENTYGYLLNRNGRACSALACLRERASVIGLLPLRWSWAHGDFKPENVLYDGRRIVLLDTKLDVRGAVVYDIASFLNHILIAGRGFGGGTLRKSDQCMEAAFLSGYGGLDAPETAALRWGQLYFMLCYLGRYGKRGIFSAVYANWWMGPLIDQLAARLA